jgi:hypothetical protein
MLNGNVILSGSLKKSRPADSSELTRLRRLTAANLANQDILRANTEQKIKEMQGLPVVNDFRLYRVVMKNTRAAVPNLSSQPNDISTAC